MIRVYCDMPGCERDVSGEDRYELRVTRITTGGKDIPAMAPLETCAFCFERMKLFLGEAVNA